MVKIEGLTDLNGKSKDERLKEIEEKNSLYGNFWAKPKLNLPLIFFYSDSTKCMVTTDIQKYDYIEKDKLHIITTKNSIYYFKEI